MKYRILVACTCIILLSFQSSVMSVRTGEVFKVILKSNRSTGYSWHWENKSEAKIIDSIYVDYVLKDKAITGSGGNEIWEFRAKRKGEQELIMVYKRPWKDSDGDQRKTFLVKVK